MYKEWQEFDSFLAILNYLYFSDNITCRTKDPFNKFRKIMEEGTGSLKNAEKHGNDVVIDESMILW